VFRKLWAMQLILLNLDPKDPLFVGKKPPGVECIEYPDGRKDRDAMTYYKISHCHNSSVLHRRAGFFAFGRSSLSLTTLPLLYPTDSRVPGVHGTIQSHCISFHFLPGFVPSPVGLRGVFGVVGFEGPVVREIERAPGAVVEVRSLGSGGVALGELPPHVEGLHVAGKCRGDERQKTECKRKEAGEFHGDVMPARAIRTGGRLSRPGVFPGATVRNPFDFRILSAQGPS